MSTAATSKLANATLKVPAQLWPGAERASNALQGLLPSKLPSSLSASKKNLYETLARLPPDAVQGTVVHQTRWGRKGIEGSYWKITRLQTKNMGSNGKAWGVLYWRGEFPALLCSSCLDSLVFACWSLPHL
jgi:hypothetical protein